MLKTNALRHCISEYPLHWVKEEAENEFSNLVGHLAELEAENRRLWAGVGQAMEMLAAKSDQLKEEYEEACAKRDQLKEEYKEACAKRDQALRELDRLEREVD